MKRAIILLLVSAAILLSGCQQFDPCEDVTCEDKCVGITLMAEGECELGECIYTVTPNSETCGYVVDLCAGVVCPDRCDDTTLFTGGRCSGGVCGYTTVPNSPDCGYEGLQLEVDITLQACIYDHANNKFDLFFTIRNVGDVIPEQGASVWLVGPEISNRSYELVQAEYPRGQILWGDKLWDYPWQGNVWKIYEVEKDSAIAFQLIYCELENIYTEECNADVGQVLYEDNTGSEDINCTG